MKQILAVLSLIVAFSCHSTKVVSTKNATKETVSENTNQVNTNLPKELLISAESIKKKYGVFSFR
ncbi:hypothetical protein [Lacinutrix salivirga]